MLFKKNILILFIAFYAVHSFAQKDSTDVKVNDVKILGNIKTSQGVYDPLAPSKAAFYSAIFPGMGQIYNKKYWKAPIVWGALAIPVYYYQINNNDYKRYRTAYKLRKAGLQDEFTLEDGSVLVSTETLETAQEQLKENRDFSLLSGIIIYVLQIVEASVNAHLLQFNTDDNLSIKPAFIPDPIQFEAPTVGLQIKFTF
ncbi:hypothetical protein BW723_10030 [Polaribacter reichenbachii]|uniref:DUF5683 domain-containing protein n=1 Tax=Polaribacter reichenbachii TaxID=996801 RepID=A0A1B8U5K1_9FLAO|nr:DUF5683 domain-containing protein [Polaribacter reichenbachii]APZ46610.1 hypothetical protein BW723_10030 [Polaribacter reichenbachii]AUC17255.1 hypothetical protein BTO17_00480 [Polaribacter reichenbachii]OBY67147.1 hypothetical protein LPB301_03800 [Polaribacter reichenbachii]